MSLPSARRFLIRSVALALLTTTLACAKSDEQWKEDLRSEDPFVRGMAAIGLCLQSPQAAEPALPVLLRTIDRTDVGLEVEAARVLAHIGRFHVQALLEHLVENELISADRRGSIQNALVQAGSEAPGPIIACLRGEGAFLVGDLGDVLLSIGEPSVPAIVEMLREGPDARLQYFAAFLLGKLGRSAQSALPALRASLSSPDDELRNVAQQAIHSIENSLKSASR